MGLGRSLGVGALALGAIVACSHGVYDGNGAPDASAKSGKVVDVAANAAAKIVTDDRFFALQIPEGAFTAPARIEIKQLADRTVDGTVVPAYEVTSTIAIAAGKRVAVILSAGNGFPGGSGGPERALAVARVSSAGTSVLAGGVMDREYFGLTKELGTFTIAYGNQAGPPGSSTPPPSSCFYDTCCGASQGGNRVCVGGSPFCQRGGGSGGGGSNDTGSAGTSDFSCYLGCSDVDALTTTCSAGGPDAGDPDSGTPGNRFQCGTAGDCGSTKCCVSQTGAPRCDNVCGLGLKISCTKTSQCPGGQQCCHVLGEVQCTDNCAGQRVCEGNEDCGGSNPGQCDPTPKCFFGVCTGANVPPACK